MLAGSAAGADGAAGADATSRISWQTCLHILTQGLRPKTTNHKESINIKKEKR
jgi:hypothetical protein